jgi:DNA-binding SARP family transcriptional activator
MEFRILGSLEVIRAGSSVKLGGARQQTVMATLLLDPERIIPMGRLIEAVWDDHPPITAREQIHICVSNLRQITSTSNGTNLIETSSPGYALQLVNSTLDARVFDSRVQEGRNALADNDPAAAAIKLRSALSLWRGSALAGVESALVQSSVLRLNERRLNVLQECIAIEMNAGLSQDLVSELVALVEDNPLDERFRVLLMTALYRSGRQAEAVECYRHGRAVLRDELGVAPGGILQRLNQLILSGKPLPRTADAPEGAAVRELVVSQAHVNPKLAKETRAQHWTQPPTPQPAESGAPMLLPATIQDLTGREELIGRVMAAMSPPAEASQAVPIAVFYGPGGVGKTAIAVRVAHRLASHFPDGQLFAQLQSGSRRVDPFDILGRFLRILGVSGTSLPQDLEERAEVYRNLLAKRRMLVVLDNVASEDQIGPLLPGSPQCSVLMTSRRRLTGLPAPSCFEIGTLSRCHAIALLARIVGDDRVKREPDAAQRLCALCGCLPLALRIAGARLAARPHLSLATLVDRLVDESGRLDELGQGSMGMRASIFLSYNALSAPERRLLRLLALWEAPNFSVWVAAALIGTDLQCAEDLLEGLTEAFLLDTEPKSGLESACYRFHDIVRPFARERLLAEEELPERRAALKRLIEALLDLAEQAHRRVYPGEYPMPSGQVHGWHLPEKDSARLLENPLAWYECQRQFIVAGVRQAAASGLVELSWNLALSAVPLYESHSYYVDWRDTHESALNAACHAGDKQGEAAIRYSLGALYTVEQKNDLAMRQLGLSGRLYEELGDQYGRALVLCNLAFLDRLNGDVELAFTRCWEALEVFCVVGDRIAEAFALKNMAQIHLDNDEDETATSLLTRAALVCDEASNVRVGTQVRSRLAARHLKRADF